jgi:curved DNA-binding protein
MHEPDDFIDHYEILHVTPGCDASALEAAYRFHAKMYHPDHAETSDVDKFNEVISAYRILRDPETRAKYDLLHASRKPRAHAASNGQGSQLDQDTTLNDAEIHEKVLVHLYKRRRENASDAGVGSYMLQEFMGCSQDHFEFHMWYLREKGFLEVTEQGTYAITIHGIDHVISQSRQAAAEKLLIAEAKRTQS